MDKLSEKVMKGIDYQMMKSYELFMSGFSETDGCIHFQGKMEVCCKMRN